MENKKGNLSTVLLVIATILIIIMGGLMYIQKTEADRQRIELENNASKMQETINDLQGKIDSIVNTLNSENTNNTTDSTISENASDSKYSEITKSLENNDVFSITDAIKNNNNTYTLKGKIITVDTSKEQIAEYPFYKETDEYRQITVSSDTKCVYSLDSNEFKTDTVENVFSKKLYFGGCFNFTFKNGKCTSVNEVITGH